MRIFRIPHIQSIPRARTFTASKALLQDLPHSTRAGKLEAKPSTEKLAPGALAGKVAIITGASRGIGAAVAERFAKEGARCILVGRDKDRLTKVRDGLVAEYETTHGLAIGDVRDVEWWKELSKKHKQTDILVNAAGISPSSTFVRTDPDMLDEVVRTNLTGTMMACRIVARQMMAQSSNIDRGCIINISSLLGLRGGRGSVAYSASKAGVIGLTTALAAEIGRVGIRVNVIVPGYIETDMTAAMTPEARSEALNAIPAKRFGQASEVADAAVFLATNKYANNCVLNLDGGLSAV